MNLTPTNNVHEFEQFLFAGIDLNLYEHKFLNDYIQKAINGSMPLYQLSVINTSLNGWLMILHGDVLLVYGNNWNINQIEEISEVFDLNKFTNYSITGDNAIIDELIKFYKPKNIEIEKRRLLYRANKINNFRSRNLQVRLGSWEEIDELALMLQQYYHEEYNGLNDKTIEDMRQRIVSLILERSIYVLVDKNEKLLSFCTVIDPDIGILFTKQEHRNRGCGKIILSHCSNLLKEQNNTVFLMTDRDKVESNVVCEAVGFRPFYSYIMTKINFG